jgi:SulP family sulfate permease
MATQLADGLPSPVLSRKEGSSWSGDLLGGFAAMLVALPSAIAFGVVVYAPLGPNAASEGALSGVLGTIVLGCVAALFGGTDRLVTAPSAPAAAVLGGLVAELIEPGGAALRPELVPAALAAATFGCGLLQLLFGAVGGGRIIKFIPYPVVSGYLSGVGTMIVIGQLPKLLGSSTVLAPSSWDPVSIAVGFSAALGMFVFPRVTRRIPAVVLTLAFAIALYFCLAVHDPRLLLLEGNARLIGPISSAGGAAAMPLAILHGLTELPKSLLHGALMPVLALAVLLSIDTLKTSVMLDSLTRTRHRSNRELVAQGLANAASALSGGLAGSGATGPTLVNLTSGGRTRLSGFSAGASALLALALWRWIEWVPVPALSGILVVVGVRMVDRSSFRLLVRRSTILDFVVIASVVVAAIAFSLIVAAGVGVGMAILLFLREQVSDSVVRRRARGDERFSKRKRLPEEMDLLRARGATTVIFELRGTLFFGTADQLYSELEPTLATARHVILDLSHVRSVDITAAQLLVQLEQRLADLGAWLVFSGLSGKLPDGQQLESYFHQVGLTRHARQVKVCPELDDALEWVEDRLLSPGPDARREEAAPLPLAGIDLMRGFAASEIAELERCCRELELKAGERLFAGGASGDEIFFVRSGRVRVEFVSAGGVRHHIATFSRGDFLGDLAFLDRQTRTAEAFAETPARLYAMARHRFNELSIREPRVGARVFARLATVLSLRLRQTDGELLALQDD